MLYIFKCRDGDIIIPQKQYETFLNIEWFITNLIKYSDDKDTDNLKIIELYESKNAVLTIFDSIRFNKLIVYNESIDYILSLADYWCSPKWLLDELEKESKKTQNQNQLYYPNIDPNSNTIVQCKNCKIGFKLNENNNQACKRHLYCITHTSEIFSCCGRGPNDSPCLIGFHVPE